MAFDRMRACTPFIITPGTHHRFTTRRVKVFNLSNTMAGMGLKRWINRLLRLMSLTHIMATTMQRKQELLLCLQAM